MDSGETNELSDDDDVSWQLVRPQKRPLVESPKIHSNKRHAPNSDPTTSINYFASLAENDDNEEETVANQDMDNSEPKPPPIMIPCVDDIRAMVNKFSKIIKPDEFTYKSLSGGNIRVMVKTIKSYRVLVKYLDDKGINFHTFQLKQERAYRVVVKNLHFSTPTVLIQDAIEEKGHKVRNIVNIKSSVSRNPLPMFYIDLEPADNNMEIYKIKHLYNATVQIEAPIKKDDIVQCFRCQQYGHTKSYCRNHFKCVKCGLNHATAQCTKPANTPPQCANCLKVHTANYKGCQTYQQILQRKKLSRPSTYGNIPRPDFNINATNFPILQADNQNNNYTCNGNPSYSDAVKNATKQQFDPFTNIEALLKQQIELTNTLLNMMSALLTKLCN